MIIVQTYLEVLLPSLAKLSERLFKPHLPGGKLNNIDPKTKEKFKSTPKTSCFAESVFGQLDQLLKCKPSLTTLAAEACIMFSNNKTMQWLKSKTDVEVFNLVTKASTDVKYLRKKFKQRQHEIAENRRLAIQLAIEKTENARREKIRKIEMYTKDILNHGLWQSEYELENMLKSYTSTKYKIEALKAQIKFRKAEAKETFNLKKKKTDSKSRINLSVDELTTNLKILIRQAVVKDKDSNQEQHMLVGKRVRHNFKSDGTSTWYTGKVISQVISLFQSIM